MTIPHDASFYTLPAAEGPEAFLALLDCYRSLIEEEGMGHEEAWLYATVDQWFDPDYMNMMEA
jgi:hypothetical protein